MNPIIAIGYVSKIKIEVKKPYFSLSIIPNGITAIKVYANCADLAFVAQFCHKPIMVECTYKGQNLLFTGKVKEVVIAIEL